MTVAGTRVCVEAVVPTPGAADSPDRVFRRPPGNWSGRLYPEAQLLLRYRSALEEKLAKVDGWVAKGLLSPTDVVLVAVNQGAIIDSYVHDVEVPAIAKAVFPIGEPVVIVTPYSEEEPHVEVPPRFSIEKKSGAEVSTTLFTEERSAPLAGVLFASQLVWALSTDASESLGLVHNPMAVSPCPRGALPLRCEMWADDGLLKHQGRCAHLE